MNASPVAVAGNQDRDIRRRNWENSHELEVTVESQQYQKPTVEMLSHAKLESVDFD